MAHFWDKWFNDIMAFYDKAMKVALRFPLVRVDKEKYLRKIFKEATEEEMRRVLEERPSVVYSMDRIHKIAKREIRKHALIVTLLSILAAIPQEGVMMWLGIVFDFVQFQLYVFIILQKLLYIYGCKRLTSEEGKLNQSADWILLLISTVMIGKHQLVRMAKTAAGMAVKQTVQRFAVRMLTKLFVFNVLRQCAKWFGIVLTKDMIVSSMALLVPAFCAIISGLISLWLFLPMTNRLQKHLTKLTEEGKDPMESTMEIM